jgi:hypothetical protein
MKMAKSNLQKNTQNLIFPKAGGLLVKVCPEVKFCPEKCRRNKESE